jgi:5-formyltetrahydrofolate cyclo-ligase
MQVSGSTEKKALRREMRARRDAATAEQRAAWSTAIAAHVLAWPAYQAASVIHGFLSIQSEVDTRPILDHALAHGKRVLIPLFVRHSDETPCCEITSLADEAFEVGGFGLCVPHQQQHADPALIDLVLVPLLAFAPAHTGQWLRLGYGAGYYDTFLRRTPPRAPKLGLAFGLQRVPTLPQESHDTLLDAVMTESGLAVP